MILQSTQHTNRWCEKRTPNFNCGFTKLQTAAHLPCYTPVLNSSTDHTSPQEQGRDICQLDKGLEHLLRLQLVSRRQNGAQHLPTDETTAVLQWLPSDMLSCVPMSYIPRGRTLHTIRQTKQHGASHTSDLKHLRENRMERGLLRFVRDSLEHGGGGLEGGRGRCQLG